MRSLSNFEKFRLVSEKIEFFDLANLARYPKRFKTRGTCVQRPKTGTIYPFGTIQSSLSLSTALGLSQDALHYSQKLNWDAQWLFEKFVSQWNFFIHIIRSSSLGADAPLCTPKVLFWTIQSSLSLSSAPWQSKDVSNYSQIHKLNAFWLCKKFDTKWKFCAHVIRSSSLGPSSTLHTTKRLLDQSSK